MDHADASLRIDPSASRASQFFRVGRVAIMAITYLGIAWSLRLSIQAKSLWVVLLVLFALLAFAIHLGERIALSPWSRINRFVVQVSHWKGRVFLFVFGVWCLILLGPGTETRYWIHPTKCVMWGEDDWVHASFYYLEHPRYESTADGSPKSIRDPIGGEGIGIFDQTFLREQRSLDGSFVPVVLTQQWRFGWPDPFEWQLYAVGDFLWSDHHFTWGDNTTWETMKVWSPVDRERALTKHQAEQALGRKLP